MPLPDDLIVDADPVGIHPSHLAPVTARLPTVLAVRPYPYH